MRNAVMKFDGTQKSIGHGAQAEVLLYHGFAYKIYKPSYPVEWISFEIENQKTVNKAGLCPVKYYETDDPHVVKMDYVEGETLEKFISEDPQKYFAMLSQAFRQIHAADPSGVKISPFLLTIETMLTDEEKAKVLPTVERLSQKYKSVICHLDLHFLNIMLAPNKTDFTVIDWITARLAPPVFDYARTWVIFNEASKEAVDFYMQTIGGDVQALGISENDFYEAVEVSKIIRSHEK